MVLTLCRASALLTGVGTRSRTAAFRPSRCTAPVLDLPGIPGFFRDLLERQRGQNPFSGEMAEQQQQQQQQQQAAQEEQAQEDPALLAEQSAEADEMVESATAAASEEEGAHGRDPRFAPPWITDNPELLADLRARSTAEPKPATASRSEAIAPIVNLEQLEVRAGGSDFVDVAQTAGGRLPLLTRVSLALCPSQAAIARADARNRLVCVKYYAPWCQSCFAIKPFYERAAGAQRGTSIGPAGPVHPAYSSNRTERVTGLLQMCAEGPMADHVDFYEVDGGCARVLVALADVRSMPVVHVYARGGLQATRPINSKPLFDEFSKGLVQLVLECGEF